MDTVKIEELLLKLTYCEGIGIVGRWRVYQYACFYHYTEFSENEIIQVAQLKAPYGVFRESWRKLSSSWLAEKLQGQHFVTIESEDYPSALKPLPYPPLVLFYEGNLQWLDYPAIAFVGAREASFYAREVVQTFVPELVREKQVIISGLAKGVDTYSHQSTLVNNGKTIGVIGCGLDICYPKQNQFIFEKMKKEQLVLSEYPKGTSVKRHHFPLRNRIIAGLSQGTCVIEAKERSGSLITAQLALEYGREVYAVPGNILDHASDGCHRLIQDGAKCVYSVQDILEEI